MSDTLMAIMPHPCQSTAQVLAMRDTLATVTEEATRVAEMYWEQPERWDSGWRWSWYQEPSTPERNWHRHGCARLDGPSGTTVAIGRQCLFINTVAKWAVARSGVSVLLAGHSLFGKVAAQVGANSFVVCHSGELTQDWVLAGLSFEQLRDNFNTSWRQVSTVHDLLVMDGEAGHYEHNLYYVAYQT